MATCAKCGRQGHNSRTCGREAVAAPEATPPPKTTKKVERSVGTRRVTKASAKAPTRSAGPLAAIEAAIAELRADIEALESAADVLRGRR